MVTVDELPAVKQGQWFFGGVTVCPVRIVRHHILQGTHDPEDPPELAEDRRAECYYVRYHLPRLDTPWLDGGMALSLREAVFLAERKLGPVVNWND
ncbi:hypothetical protein [Tepidicella xavieri]|jgi:hypothetical protein|uniref:Uncharacterized protein n=1 Tax=Tepidicella xavieri TaxID=360241 RepID=A0A4R6UFZ1_9BURK|nr:hypothetical protein [Tepidicella xavieri]TDQ44896.1 hypothetical protein DFR43_102244 [Tepidicella xavieri]